MKPAARPAPKANYINPSDINYKQILPAPSGAGWSVNRTFNTAGTFRYHCGFHGASMPGE